MSHIDAQEEPNTSISLLGRAQRGDSESWKQLVQVYGPIVYGWTRRCGLQPADSADVMQEVFVAVARTFSRFDHNREGGTFRGWLWTITRNKVRDLKNDSRSPKAAGGTAANLAMQGIPAAALPKDPPTDVVTDRNVAKHRLVQLLRDQFDPRSWQMFWETTICQRKVEDVAEELGVSKWAVYKARARVLHRLKQEMDGLD